MLGAWVSGGIEWCVFHHHRNTTHMPVDYTLAENDDGSKTIWFGETERRHRMKWLIGITLKPGSSCIETTVKLFNRTAQPHSILYWANVAVHVNDDYQVVFPPSANAVTYHSKNDFAHLPVADETYRGVNLSWWKNHPEPISFFTWDLQEDFMGGYAIIVGGPASFTWAITMSSAAPSCGSLAPGRADECGTRSSPTRTGPTRS